MLFMGDRSVGYWELPSSGVRLNETKVELDDGHLIRAACQGDAAAFGLGSYVVVLFAVGIACYVAGAVVFSRREIPAPL